MPKPSTSGDFSSTQATFRRPEYEETKGRLVREIERQSQPTHYFDSDGNQISHETVNKWNETVLESLNTVGATETNDAELATTLLVGDWRIRWVFARQPTGMVVRSMSIEAVPDATPTGGITAGILRALSPAKISAQAGQAFTEPKSSSDSQAERVARLLATFRRDEISRAHPASARAEHSGPGRPPLPDELLREVALAYIDEVKGGRGIYRRLSQRFGRPEETIRDWIRISRREGFLAPAAKRGARSAEPGPRLREKSTTRMEEDGK